MTENKETITLKEKLTIRILVIIIRIINYSWFRLEHNTEIQKILQELDNI